MGTRTCPDRSFQKFLPQLCTSVVNLDDLSIHPHPRLTELVQLLFLSLISTLKNNSNSRLLFTVAWKMIGSKSFNRLAYTVVIETKIFCCRSVDQLILNSSALLFLSFSIQGGCHHQYAVIRKKNLAKIFYALSILWAHDSWICCWKTLEVNIDGEKIML